MSKYYVKTSRDGRVQGPFTREQLTGLASKGKLQGDHLVSKDAHEWYIARNIRDLPLAAPASAADESPATANAAALAARAATAHRPAKPVAPPRGPRLPAMLITGLVSALLAVVALTAWFLHSGNGNSDGPPPVATGQDRGPSAPKPSPKPAAAVKPVPPPPAPKPKRRFEPLKPPQSYQVLSVRYAGQVVRAMGSQLAFVLTNNSGKRIQSVQGTIRLYDASDAFLVALPVEIGDAIDNDASITKKGVWLNVGGALLGLLEKSPATMKFKFAADRVTYEGGASDTF